MSVKRTISSLGAATYVNHDDLLTLVREGESALADRNKKITKATWDVAGAAWTALNTDAYQATPPGYSYAGGSFTSVPDWVADTVQNVGDYVKPTTENGYIYEAVAVAGDQKTHATTEPVWPTTLGDEIVDDQVTWRCRGAFVIDMDEDLTAVIRKGTPLKYVYDSVAYYGLCLDISATYLAVAGAPLLLNHNLTALYYGPPQRVIPVRFWHSGDYDGGVADIDAQPRLKWIWGPANLVYFTARHETDDTGTEPMVNIKINAAVVSADGDLSGNPDKGVRMSTSWVANHPTAIKVANYDVQFDELVTPTLTVAGGTGNATGLSICAAFVLQ